jgi:hypothetical protein
MRLERVSPAHQALVVRGSSECAGNWHERDPDRRRMPVPPACTHHARIDFTTLPSTSVKR